MFGPERIETLLSELNDFADEIDDTRARLTLVDIYGWIYHSNRGAYEPATALSSAAVKRFPQLAKDLAALRPCLKRIPARYRPVITTREVDPTTEGSGWYLLIDGVIVDRSWKESDLFDDHAEAIIDDPYRAYLWRESSKVLAAIERKPRHRRKMTWCEIGQHEMPAYGTYCYSWRDIICCRECLDKHIATYFPARKEA